jgi:hypothetical protein
MLNLHRLKYLKEHNPNDSLQYVADFILDKLQRDKSEFSSYTQDDDWSEFEQYLHNLDTLKHRNDIRLIQKMLQEISDNEGNMPSESDFEKSLIARLSLKDH